MQIIIETLQYPWAQRALLAAIWVGISCGLLGSFIVLRNMSLIGDALSHSILPGIVAAFVLWGYSPHGFFIGALAAGLFTAIAIVWIQKRFQTKADAAVGIVFTTMFAIGVIGISALSQQKGIHLDLKDFLFGNILGVSTTDLYLTGTITIFTILSIVLFYRHLFLTSFQPVVADTMGISSSLMNYFLMFLLSLVVVSALQMVGVIMVVSMLITPAATALLLSDKLERVLIISGTLGVLSGIIGFMGAVYFEIPPGPAMTITAAFFYVLAGLFAPEKGWTRKWIQKRQSKNLILQEDVVKNIYKNINRGDTPTVDSLQIEGVSARKLKSLLKLLQKKGWIKVENGNISLAGEGIQIATRLVRAHRLWESYLAGRVGLSETQIHKDAEILEHILPEDLLDEVERALNYPDTDPHGAPIPPKLNKPIFSITHLYPGEVAVITEQQISEHVSAELWRIGLQANSPITLQKRNDKKYIIQSKEFSIEIPARLARLISVKKA